MQQYTFGCVYTHTLNTHPSLCRFLLQLFISPCHFEACSCLPVSHPPNSYFSFAPLLLHFMRLCLPSSFLPVSDSRLFPLSVFVCSESVIKYFIMSLWTKWNVALPSSCTFFPLLLLHHSSWFLPPVSCMQPHCNTKLFLQLFFFVTFPSRLNTWGDF